jgi:hypothetical protein
LKTFNNNVLALCFNILENTGGDIRTVLNFIDRNNYAVGINEDAIHRLLDFWWKNTTFEKTLSKDKIYYYPKVAEYLDFIADVFDIGARLATLGFVESDVEVEQVWIEYGASVTVPRPEFDLKEGNKLELKDYSVKATLYARAKARISTTVKVDTSGFVPDWMTPWEDDIVVSRKTSVVTLFPPPPLESLSLINIDAKTSATGSVVLNADNELAGKIEALDIKVDFGPEWYKALPEFILNDMIIALLKELALSKLNSFLVFPAVIVKQIPKIGFNLSIDLNLLDVDDQEVFVGADIDVKELKTPVQPVPKYIANRNPKSREVHRSDCVNVQRMNEANKVGYYTLQDAFRDGYDGCKDCIPEYHTR